MKLSRGKISQDTVLLQKVKYKQFDILGKYAACGFEVGLKRKHEPLVFQVKYFEKDYFSTFI